MVDSTQGSSISDGDLQQFFQRMLLEANENQQGQVSHHAISYVTELLVAFHETAKLFEAEKSRLPVLADIFSKALESDRFRRFSLLRQLGDTSLMLSGYFPEAITRRSVDLDYYQNMGKVAYSHLDSLSNDLNIFCELSDQFISLSRVINEVSENTHERAEPVQALLDYYMSTGSHHVLEKLKKKGVIPLHPKKGGGVIL